MLFRSTPSITLPHLELFCFFHLGKVTNTSLYLCECSHPRNDTSTHYLIMDHEFLSVNAPNFSSSLFPHAPVPLNYSTLLGSGVWSRATGEYDGGETRHKLGVPGERWPLSWTPLSHKHLLFLNRFMATQASPPLPWKHAFGGKHGAGTILKGCYSGCWKPPMLAALRRLQVCLGENKHIQMRPVGLAQPALDSS